MTHSLLYVDDLARLVEREYAIAAPVKVSLLNRGFNDTYLVTDVAGGRRVLRVYNRDKYWIRSESDLRFELDLLEHLAAAGLGVIRPYQRTVGDRLGRLTAPEGERRFALFTHAPGAPSYEGTLTAERWREFGSGIARMHLEMDTFQTSHDLVALYRGPDSPDEDRERWAAVVSGYQQVRPLSPAEVDGFPVLAACRAMWDIGDWLGAADRTGDAWVTEARIARLLADVRKDAG